MIDNIDTITEISDYKKRTFCPECYVQLRKICDLESSTRYTQGRGICSWCNEITVVRVYLYRGWIK